MNLVESYDRQPQVVQAILSAELNRPDSARASLAEYSPNFIRTLTQKYDLDFALTYFAHILQEIHIADKEAREAGASGILQVFMGDLLQALKDGTFDPKKQSIWFTEKDGALVAAARKPALPDISDLHEFTDGESLRGKRVLFVGIGGGSDGIQASMVGKLMQKKYGCNLAGVVSIRNQERKIKDRETYDTIGQATIQIRPDTQPDSDWRFLENIPLQDNPMYLLNSTDPAIIQHDIQSLQEKTGADIIISVDTGGDSLYTNRHASFSTPQAKPDITPDQDYTVIESLAAFSQQHAIPVFSTIVAPGVDSPDYAHQILTAIEAKRMLLDDEDKTLVKTTYGPDHWRMDGSGNDDTPERFGKTPLAWLHALQKRLGFQILDLPKRHVTSITNPWRAFTMITPAMAEIVITDIQKHYAAIRRDVDQVAIF